MTITSLWLREKKTRFYNFLDQERIGVYHVFSLPQNIRSASEVTYLYVLLLNKQSFYDHNFLPWPHGIVKCLSKVKCHFRISPEVGHFSHFFMSTLNSDIGLLFLSRTVFFTYYIVFDFRCSLSLPGWSKDTWSRSSAKISKSKTAI